MLPMINLKQLLTESFDKDLFTAKYTTDKDKHHKLLDKYPYKSYPGDQHPADHHHRIVDSLVRDNKSTHPEILHRLSNHAWRMANFAVSTHPNTADNTLEHLANHKDADIRYNVANHPNTNYKTLRKLATDHSLVHDPRYSYSYKPNISIKGVAQKRLKQKE